MHLLELRQEGGVGLGQGEKEIPQSGLRDHHMFCSSHLGVGGKESAGPDMSRESECEPVDLWACLIVKPIKPPQTKFRRPTVGEIILLSCTYSHA